MLDLYHAMAGDDDEDGGSRERLLGRADLVMSFVNMGECGLRGWALVTLLCPCDLREKARVRTGTQVSGRPLGEEHGLQGRLHNLGLCGGPGPSGEWLLPG